MDADTGVLPGPDSHSNRCREQHAVKSLPGRQQCSAWFWLMGLREAARCRTPLPGTRERLSGELPRGGPGFPAGVRALCCSRRDLVPSG